MIYVVAALLALLLIALIVHVTDLNGYAHKQTQTLLGLMHECERNVQRLRAEKNAEREEFFAQLAALTQRTYALEQKPQDEVPHREVALIGPIEVRLLK